jgi:hypothetical protein
MNTTSGSSAAKPYGDSAPGEYDLVIIGSGALHTIDRTRA